MLLSCNSCHKEYVASNRSSQEEFVCTKCLSRGKEHNTKLGLHPALERRFAQSDERKTIINSPRSTHLSGHKGASDKMLGLNTMPSIPGFDIAYQVGRGAMGQVYRARQIKTGRMVAIKVLSHELSLRSDLVARFEREAYALKSLTNENVVTVIDAGHVEDIHYFAMEFIDGITLRTRINRGPISLREAIYISLAILNGLKAAHQHGIIHRDLKPENVLLAYPDSDFSSFPKRVVLVDFGLVGIGGLAFDPHPNLTRSKVTMGTVNYMAPEQHVDAKRVDHRSDLYSLGVILFEMLTGDLPLGRYLMPSERGMGTPVALDAILMRSLARGVLDRFSSAEQFMDELNKLSAMLEAPPINSSPKGRQNLPMSFANWWVKARYGLLIVAAGLFFATGIKLAAKPKATTGIETTKKEVP